MANTLRYEIPARAGVLTGTDGNDTYQGTPNVDTAQFDAGRHGAVVLDGARGPLSVASTAGIDTVNNVETLLFVDGREVYDPNDAAAQVLRIYDTVLGRELDQTGLNTFVQLLDNGTALKDVAASLIGSAEFTSHYGASLTDAQFVDILYQNMRGASGSIGEVASWTSLLSNGQMTRADVAAGFASSAESQANTAATLAQGLWDRDESAVSIANLYDTAFDRLADTDGMATWVSRVHHDNATMKDVAEAFLATNEASALRAMDNAAFINEVYQNALGRQADVGGLATWLGELGAGHSRAEVMLAISDSAEHQQITAELFQSDNPLSYGVTLLA